MRRLLRSLSFFILAVSLLTVTAFADMGPKPQLIIRVENAPEELYYLDLLEEGAPDNSYRTEEDLAPYDQSMIAAMRTAIPEGWYACFLDNSWIFGDLTGKPANGQMLHQFSYYGVPNTYKIAIVTTSGEVWLSDTYTREVLQSSVTLDWATKAVTIPSTDRAYAVQFLAAFLPTLLVEGLLLALFGLWRRKNLLVFLLVNVITQGGLAVFFGINAVRYGVSGGYPFLLLAAELAVLFVEYLLYRRFLSGRSPERIAAYAIAANTCTAILGFITAEPIWRFVVSIL